MSAPDIDLTDLADDWTIVRRSDLAAIRQVVTALPIVIDTILAKIDRLELPAEVG